jgi:hypothetical protein
VIDFNFVWTHLLHSGAYVVLGKPGAAGSGVPSLRQAGHALKLQHQAKRYDHIVHIAARVAAPLVVCVSALPPDQATPLWQAAQAQATEH